MTWKSRMNSAVRSMARSRSSAPEQFEIRPQGGAQEAHLADHHGPLVKQLDVIGPRLIGQFGAHGGNGAAIESVVARHVQHGARDPSSPVHRRAGPGDVASEDGDVRLDVGQIQALLAEMQVGQDVQPQG